MSRKSKPCSDLQQRNGLTLVEVVAGLLLMSTLLVGILMACGGQIRQTKLAQRRLAAVRLADGLLTQWFNDSEQTLSESSGGSPEGSGLSWQIRSVESGESCKAMNVEVVRLEILTNDAHDKQEPLVVVDVVKPRLPTKTAPNNKGQ